MSTSQRKPMIRSASSSIQGQHRGSIRRTANRQPAMAMGLGVAVPIHQGFGIAPPISANPDRQQADPSQMKANELRGKVAALVRDNVITREELTHVLRLVQYTRSTNDTDGLDSAIQILSNTIQRLR